MENSSFPEALIVLLERLDEDTENQETNQKKKKKKNNKKSQSIDFEIVIATGAIERSNDSDSESSYEVDTTNAPNFNLSEIIKTKSSSFNENKNNSPPLIKGSIQSEPIDLCDWNFKPFRQNSCARSFK